MQEVTIQYSNPKTLKFLKEVAKYFDFVVISPKKSKTVPTSLKGVTLLQGTGKPNNTEMEQIFTQNNVDAKELRSKWQRK